MVTQAQTKWLEGYKLLPLEGTFFSRFFQLTTRGVFQGTKISYDAVRRTAQIAVPVGRGGSPRMNTGDNWVNKEFTPPQFKEGAIISWDDLYDRQFGESPITEGDQARAANIVMRSSLEMGSNLADKIARALELQSAQVFQTGGITTVDETGATVFSETFGAPAAHFASAGVLWTNAATATPLTDLENHCQLILANGGSAVTDIPFGGTAWSSFLNTDQVQKRADIRNYELLKIGGVATPPEFANCGAYVAGEAMLAGQRVRLWNYERSYINAQGSSAKYLAANKVSLIAGDAPYVTVSGIPPVQFGSDAQWRQFLPGSATRFGRGGFAIAPRAFAAQHNVGVEVVVESRSLQIPVNPASFGCLTVTA